MIVNAEHREESSEAETMHATGTDAESAHVRRALAAHPWPLLGFFSRLPWGGASSLEAVVAAFPLVPLVGWVVGGLSGLAALILSPFLPAAPLAAILLTMMVGLTGLNQMDGLLDLGDGLMVHGDTEKRLRVMHDHSAGVGAVAAVLFTYLLAFAALAGIIVQVGAGPGADWFAEGARRLAVAVVVAEVAARLPYLFLAWRGRSSHGGLGSAFLEGFGAQHVMVGCAAAAPVVLAALLLGWIPVLLAVIASLLTAAWLLRTATRLLGGVGGDVLGASQELARTAALLAISVGLTL
ncbi:MAG: adenosylcobinamide-GDP ribazoletransferase [Thermoleophilia bacterium]